MKRTWITIALGVLLLAAGAGAAQWLWAERDPQYTVDPRIVRDADAFDAVLAETLDRYLVLTSGPQPLPAPPLEVDGAVRDPAQLKDEQLELLETRIAAAQEILPRMSSYEVPKRFTAAYAAVQAELTAREASDRAWRDAVTAATLIDSATVPARDRWSTGAWCFQPAAATHADATYNAWMHAARDSVIANQAAREEPAAAPPPTRDVSIFSRHSCAA